MAYTIQLSPATLSLIERYRMLPRKVLEAIRGAFDIENQLTVGYIREKKLSQRGPYTLGVRTGLLRRSIRASQAYIAGNSVFSGIGSNVKYAGIHEFGGQTKPHLIKAKGKKALKFSVGGKTLLRRAVKHPGSRMRARGYIYNSIRERAHKYEQRIFQRLHQIIERTA